MFNLVEEFLETF